MKTATETLPAAQNEQIKKNEQQNFASQEISKLDMEETRANGMSWNASIPKWKEILVKYQALAEGGSKEAKKKIPEIEQKLTTAQIFAELKQTETSASWEASASKYKGLLIQASQLSSDYKYKFQARVEKDLKTTNEHLEAKGIKKVLESAEQKAWQMPWAQAQKKWIKLAKEYKEAKTRPGTPAKYKNLFSAKVLDMNENATLSEENIQGKKALRTIQQKKSAAMAIADWNVAKVEWRNLKGACDTAISRISVAKWKEKITAEKKEIARNMRICALNIEFDTVRNSNDSWKVVLEKYKRLKAKAAGLPVGKLQTEMQDAIAVAQANWRAKEITETSEQKIKSTVDSKTGKGWEVSKQVHETIISDTKNVTREKLTQKRKDEIERIQKIAMENITKCSKEIKAKKEGITMKDEIEREFTNNSERIEYLRDNNSHFSFLLMNYQYLSKQKNKNITTKSTKTTDNIRKIDDEEKAELIGRVHNEESSKVVLDVAEDGQLEQSIMRVQRKKLEESMKEGRYPDVIDSSANEVIVDYELQLKRIMRKMIHVAKIQLGVTTNNEKLERKIKEYV